MLNFVFLFLCSLFNKVLEENTISLLIDKLKSSIVSLISHSLLQFSLEIKKLRRLQFMHFRSIQIDRSIGLQFY